ncbi:BNR-4 repeat-containing protein [uncultured Draconibacterium sp.]|mgnify:CR=1 FL=1|uniref:BNR-4 repeat-containing protein n=1 Tax=uncultured Draconibacterium sp. TaxID=1573823 RepID=UPI002601418F|nr:BNR-4 repeat-containing protein [uncultured Draconibacterium sp.]
MKLNYLLPILFIVILFGCTSSQQKTADKTPVVKTLNEDGAWCWFSDPRAIYTADGQIVTGWVKKDGSIEVASLNPETDEAKFNNIYPQFEFDDHDNPAFTILPNGNLFTMYAWHSTGKGVLSNTTTNGTDIESFGENVVFKPTTEELLKKFPRETFTYANPFVLSEEDNKLFVFGRWIGFKPNMIISEDNGETWNEQYVIMSDDPFTPNNRPYVKYYSDGKSKIHMIFTDGHPRVEPTNSVYYCYYENGAFWKADGTKICDLDGLPFQVKDATVVYKADEEHGRAWICDVVEKDGTPYILYTRHPQETDHRYFYAWYNADTKTWEDHEICKAGKWFPQTPEGETEREPHYMGNMTFNPNKPNEIYLSREINGVFEIEKRTTNDGGNSWEIEPVTQNSTLDNVRPFIPRYQPKDSKTVVLWMENNKYIHYTDYDCSIKYYVEP